MAELLFKQYDRDSELRFTHGCVSEDPFQVWHDYDRDLDPLMMVKYWTRYSCMDVSWHLKENHSQV